MWFFYHMYRMKYNSSASGKLLNEYTFFIPLTGTPKVLTCGQTRFEWFMTKESGVYIARSMTLSSLWIASCDDTCWAVRCWTAITRRCVNYFVTWMIHTYGRCEYISMNRSWRYKTLKQKALTLGNWWQGRIPVDWLVMLWLLNLPNTLLWRTYCSEW